MQSYFKSVSCDRFKSYKTIRTVFFVGGVKGKQSLIRMYRIDTKKSMS